MTPSDRQLVRVRRRLPMPEQLMLSDHRIRAFERCHDPARIPAIYVAGAGLRPAR